MSANCAICVKSFGIFRRSNTCNECSKTVCKLCIKETTCVQCLNSHMNVRGYDEVPKNLYRQNTEEKIVGLAAQMNKLPPPSTTQVSKQAYQDAKAAEADIELRLAQLRSDGQSQPKRATRPIVRVMSVSDPDIDEEQAVKRIIEQTVAEVDMENKTQNRLTSEEDSTTSMDKELEERLNRLKSVDVGSVNPVKHKWSWQIEEEVQRKAEEEEMSKWCCICNANGHVKCRDCDDDVFCNRCFKEQHGRNNIDEHETVKL